MKKALLFALDLIAAEVEANESPPYFCRSTPSSLRWTTPVPKTIKPSSWFLLEGRMTCDEAQRLAREWLEAHPSGN